MELCVDSGERLRLEFLLSHFSLILTFFLFYRLVLTFGKGSVVPSSFSELIQLLFPLYVILDEASHIFVL